MFTPAAPHHCTESGAEFWLLANQVSKRSENERLMNIQSGFAPGWIRSVREAFRLSHEHLEELLNASTSTLERRQRQQQPLDRIVSERLDRIAMIATQAMEVFETPERASQWMLTANAALGDQRPLRLCETEIGAQQVRRALAAIAHGGVV
ncbi:MbcA/ParS/Xre antitoxin family protein [Pseudomonas cichorii]|nr:MbcA/ParS/Xre antitoxin family protein [Pseudomonas cichorii]MBX8544218.1 MbcA/ParS/Xre antitoxin family protein [Pseudomonas cichorii]MBX8559522.1 MbcA/ParS/Xre antitoxin family protein [Pseudomonas cichorii]MBX8578801.1 MbcA/ParS/Xre antitoxin family protein [Pseudomonas cichorii]MBX8589227.1 MbcA/ParS/Xre antitoxin family protein [Pseudomonas cichorii]